MRLLYFKDFKSAPEEGMPIEKMVGIFEHMAKVKPDSTLDDLGDLVVVLPARAGVHTAPRGAELKGIKNMKALKLMRGQKAVLELDRGHAAVGLTATGVIKHAFAMDVDIQERASADPDKLEAQRWLATGERGLSSEAMCHAIFGIPSVSKRHSTSHPLDRDDFRRCSEFLRAVPSAKAQLKKVRALSAVWDAYLDNWDRMEQLLAVEQVERRDMGLSTLMTKLEKAAKATSADQPLSMTP